MQRKNQNPEGQDIGNYPRRKKKLKIAKKAYGNYMTMKRNNMCITGSPEGKRKGQKAIMADNFLNLGRKMDIQIHAAQRIPNSLNLRIEGYTETHYYIVKSQRQNIF